VDITEMPPGNDGAWREWFRPELVGWSGGSIVGEGTNVVTSITQTQLAARPVGELAGPPVDIQAIVRHGYIPANTMVPVSFRRRSPAPRSLSMSICSWKVISRSMRRNCRGS
jgi:hypothetical protein